MAEFLLEHTEFFFVVLDNLVIVLLNYLGSLQDSLLHLQQLALQSAVLELKLADLGLQTSIFLTKLLCLGLLSSILVCGGR